jgi:hypothetical protein
MEDGRTFTQITVYKFLFHKGCYVENHGDAYEQCYQDYQLEKAKADVIILVMTEVTCLEKWTAESILRASTKN